MRVLHLEKDENFSKLIEDIVRQNGFSYQCVDSYEQIREAFKENEYYLLITDHQIYQEFSDHLIKQMASNGYIHPSIIVITSEQDFETKKRCFKLGIMAYLNKSAFNDQRFEMYLQTINREKENAEFLKNAKIAVLDDSRFSLEIIKSFFLINDIKNADYYQDASEFLKCNKNYDLYLTDLVMPNHNGEDLIIHIRETNDDAIIILITAYDNGEIIPHCLRCGADDYLLKPLNHRLFMSKIVFCLNHHNLNRNVARQNEKLFELATKDSLTGIYNRTCFVDAFKKKIAETCRTAEPFSLILFDIDHFKNINDEYGHLQGDYVLKEIAHIIDNSIRITDVLCRWGGEEFIVLLGNTDAEKAVLIAEKMRMLIEQHNFKDTRSVTASFGITQWQMNDDEKSALKRLDNSLYLAKLTGRNRVVSNEELQIIKGLTMTIEWGPFFRCGHPQIDSDHHKLIDMSNEIIYNCLIDNNQKIIVSLFSALTEEVVEHFKREESSLEEFEYTKYAEHKKIHQDLVCKTLKLFDAFLSGEEEPINIAKYLIQDVIIGHIIQGDFDFFPIFVNKCSSSMTVLPK